MTFDFGEVVSDGNVTGVVMCSSPQVTKIEIEIPKDELRHKLDKCVRIQTDKLFRISTNND